MDNNKGNSKTGFKWNDKADRILYPLLLEFAKENREHPTEAESILWNIVRAKGLGVTILRQYIIDQYIVDFVYKKGKLVIEVDGAYHSEPRQEASDEERTRILQSYGYRVIRFSNEDIFFNIEEVIKTIKYNL